MTTTAVDDLDPRTTSFEIEAELNEIIVNLALTKFVIAGVWGSSYIANFL